MRAGVILQVRMDSRRLPGKALAPMGDASIVEQCIRRLRLANAGPVILATTTRQIDGLLATLGAHLGVDVFRGAADDVLDRFVRCAAAYDLDHVIRATADNPGVDIDAPGRLLAALRARPVDYVREDGLPYGGAVEAVTATALARASAMATEPADREHVTTFIRARAGMFRVCELAAPPALARPDVRLTVDTPDDLRQMRALYAAARTATPSLSALIDAWDGVAAKVA